MVRNIYNDRDTLHAGVEGVPILRHSVSIRGGVQRSEYGIREENAYDEGEYALKCDCS